MARATAAGMPCWSSALPISTGAALEGIDRVGISAGASAPENLVQEVIDAFRERFEVTIEPVTVTEENVTFKLPRELAV